MAGASLMSGFFGDAEEGKTVQETKMSPEQRAAIQYRTDLYNNWLLPYANAFRAGQGIEPVDTNAGGWDEIVRAQGIQGLQAGSPWALSPAGSNWTNATQDYISGTWPSLMQNPYAYGAGGFENPMLADLGAFYKTSIDRASTAPTTAGFTPETFNYGTVFDDGSLNISRTGTTAQATPVDAIDPATAIAAAQKLVSQVIGPGVTASLSSSGMGRSGAEGEIISQRGTEVALPIAQQVLKHESDAALANAQYGTQASIASAQIQGQLAQVQFLEQSKAALQAQLLTAKSDSERQAIMADLAKVDANLQLASNQIRSQMAQTGLTTGADLFRQGAAYNLAAPGAITNLFNIGLAASELPNQLTREGNLADRNMLLSLLGLTPIPGGGTSTTTLFGEENPYDRTFNNLYSVAGLAAQAAGGMGGAAMISSRRLKTDITDLPTREQVAADMLALPVKAWRYQWEPTDRRHIGPILEEAPAYLRASPLALDVPSLFGALILTTQALDQRVRALEGA